MPHGLPVSPRRSPGGNPYNYEYLTSTCRRGQLTLSYRMLPSKRRIAAENTDRAKGAKSSKSSELACFLVFGEAGFGIISISLVIREEIPKVS